MLLSLFSNMKKLLFITTILLFSCTDIFGPSSCNEEIEVELWGECYNIMETSHLNLSGNWSACQICNPWGSLEGPISPKIGNLTNLTVLNLSLNKLTGSIPVEIGNLTNLNSLILSYCQLTGDIPQSVCNLIESNDLNINSILAGNNLNNTCD